MVKESISNVLLDSGEEIVLVDAKERGDLYEVRVVSDNPYLEVYIELDDYRNENVSAAELLAQPQTGRLLSNFQAIDGGSPAAGYTLLYNPDIPEDYQGRIRVILRNRIRPSKDVFGNPGAGRGAYRSRGDLGDPINLGYGGGAVIPHNHTASRPRPIDTCCIQHGSGRRFQQRRRTEEPCLLERCRCRAEARGAAPIRWQCRNPQFSTKVNSSLATPTSP